MTCFVHLQLTVCNVYTVDEISADIFKAMLQGEGKSSEIASIGLDN